MPLFTAPFTNPRNLTNPPSEVILPPMRPLRLLIPAALALAQAHATQPTPPPNIILILADDMGFSDLGCYGSEIETPNLDRLASNGVRFTQFYNASRCCPSRASLLTGLYSHQTGVGAMDQDTQLPGYRGRLNDQCVTIAEVLREKGYFTAVAGKWHVGGHDFSVTPWMRGFQKGIASPAGGFYLPAHDKKAGKLWLDGKNVPDNDPALPKEWYTTDLYTDFAIRYAREAVSAAKPFFLYLPFNAPHFPLTAPEADVAKYRGKYKALGWDKLREQRHQKQTQLGLLDSKLSPRTTSQPEAQDVPAWETLSEEDKDRSDEIMALYAACVDHLDQSIGKITAELESLGVFENTLILFLSHNGGSAEGGALGKLEHAKKTAPDGIHPGRAFAGGAWANLQNTPFRYYKHFEHEGGISTPFIAHWPKGIAARGALCKYPAHLIDVMPTLVAASGAPYPTERNGNTILPMEGKNLLPAFAGEPLGRGSLCWEHYNSCGIREGDWKLVKVKGQPWELYNLASDRAEANNLASAEPAKVEALQTQWQSWADRTQVFPKKKNNNP